MAKILVLHGPNLNLLGTRETKVYGSTTLEDVNRLVQEAAAEDGHTVDFLQSNHEGELVDAIQQARQTHDGIVINPAAYTHTSVALRDALLAVADHLPVVEVHLSNPWGREDFRQSNLIKDVVCGRIEGFGAHGYVLAIRAVTGQIQARG
jgi:3-dehydroquinate dehydratase II